MIWRLVRQVFKELTWTLEKAALRLPELSGPNQLFESLVLRKSCIDVITHILKDKSISSEIFYRSSSEVTSIEGMSQQELA